MEPNGVPRALAARLGRGRFDSQHFERSTSKRGGLLPRARGTVTGWPPWPACGGPRPASA